MKYPGNESSSLEFKQSIPENDQIVKTIIGFCNRSGGKLLIGIKQDGTIVGIPEEEIQRVKDGPGAAQWSPADRLLLQAADECHGGSEINETTYQDLCLHFDENQQLDIIATVGMYMTLATIIKTYKLPMENP